MSKTFKLIAIVLSVAIIGVAGYFGYTGWRNMKNDVDTQKAEVTAKEVTITKLQEELDSVNEKLVLVKEVVNPTENKENITPTGTPSALEVGYIKFSTSYPGEGTPAFRICFSNIEDISKQYCFWKKHSRDTRNYSNDLEGDTVTLPAGRYHIDFATYNDSTETDPDYVREIYAMKECVYYSESPEEQPNECTSWREELKKTPSGGYPPVQIVNYPQFGGGMYTFEVRAGKTSILKQFSLLPI